VDPVDPAGGVLREAVALAILKLHASHDSRPVVDADLLEALALDVALDPNAAGEERRFALDLDGILDPRAV
jgi:hypothetical protein